MREATNTIPIVAIGGDLVADGVVGSLARPGGNVTGIQVLQPDAAGKRLALLKETMPRLSRAGLLFGSAGQWFYDTVSEQTRAAAEALGVKLQIVQARQATDLDAALSTLQKGRAEAVVVFGDPLTYANAGRLADLTLKYRLPTMWDDSRLLKTGGLMSYGADLGEVMKRAATYVDKVLRGAKPADLPVEQPTKFELVLNMRTAKALGLTIPPSILVRADQIIE
jgi:putative tryptophan/tyrosine transport system substrate-binding protein